MQGSTFDEQAILCGAPGGAAGNGDPCTGHGGPCCGWGPCPRQDTPRVPQSHHDPRTGCSCVPTVGACSHPDGSPVPGTGAFGLSGGCPCLARVLAAFFSSVGCCHRSGPCPSGGEQAGTCCTGAGSPPDADSDGGVFVTEDDILAFQRKLREDEKSRATIVKYVSSVRRLAAWLDGRELDRSVLIEYRDFLRSGHSCSTVNGEVSAINTFLDAAGLPGYKLKLQKVQRQIFRPEDRELTMEEYEKLLGAAEGLGMGRLVAVMQTICATGIRVSELQFITVEAAKAGQAEVTLKGKTRIIAIPKDLAGLLLEYAQKNGTASGKIFLTRNGTPISRKQIWAEMKALSEKAGVAASKIFPHNLRHLFAQRYYGETHDIETLSDALGHTSIETTRIYLSSGGEEHRKIIDNLGLVLKRGDCTG